MYGEGDINPKEEDDSQEIVDEQQQEKHVASPPASDGITELKDCHPNIEHCELEQKAGIKEDASMLNGLQMDKNEETDDAILLSNTTSISNEVLKIVGDENDRDMNQQDQPTSDDERYETFDHSCIIDRESYDGILPHDKADPSNPLDGKMIDEVMVNQPEDLGLVYVDPSDILVGSNSDGDLGEEEDEEYNMVVIQSSQSRSSDSGTNQSEWRKYFRFMPLINLRGITLPIDHAQHQVKGSMGFLGNHGYGAWKTGTVPSDVVLHNLSK